MAAAGVAVKRQKTTGSAVAKPALGRIKLVKPASVTKLVPKTKAAKRVVKQSAKKQRRPRISAPVKGKVVVKHAVKSCAPPKLVASARATSAAGAAAVLAPLAAPAEPVLTKRTNHRATRTAVAELPNEVSAAQGSAHKFVPEEDVRRHMPLVRHVVQRMLPRKPPEVATEDLISWGTVGLLDALRKYDASREAAFPTYAQYRIRGAILDYLRRCDWLPRSIREKSQDIERATRALERKLGRPPQAEEIAAELNMPLEEYTAALTTVGSATMVPLRDLCFGRGEEAYTTDDFLQDSSDLGPLARSLRKERVEVLAKAIEKLPEKERVVVSFYYFEGLTMREMALALGLTEGRISQLHSQAMLRLRGHLSRITGEERFS